METTKIIQILKQVDINLFLKQNILKGVLADLLYEYEAERKILNTIHNSVNVVEKLYKSKNKLLEYQSIKKELLSYGLNESSVEWVLNIWLAVLDINLVKDKTINNNFIRISSGGSFSIALLSDKVYAWGSNKWGQLGNGTITDSINPVEITNSFYLNRDERIIDIFTSFRSAYLQTSEKRVFAWGNNGYGQLGDGTNINKGYPVDISNKINLSFDEEILHIGTGGFHSILVTSFNRIFAWGNNEFGQIGDGTNLGKNTPIDITNQFAFMNDERIEHVSVGLGHSMIVTSLDRVFTWGNNKYGQLGDNSTSQKNKPIEISSNFNFRNNEKILSISLGSLHSFVVTTLGRIFAFGNNENGQLGDLTTVSHDRPVEITNNFNLRNDDKIVMITAGKNFSLAKTSVGRVYSWGNNKNGQLSIDDYITNSERPVDITKKIVMNDEKVIDICNGASSTHSFAISSLGKIYAFGNNEWGKLGDGTTEEKRRPIEVKLAKL